MRDLTAVPSDLHGSAAYRTRVGAAMVARAWVDPAYKGRVLRDGSAAAEEFGFVGARADSVFGWIIRPPGFDATKRYPLVYLIHGGPQGAWLDQWHSRWNYAVFASRGINLSTLESRPSRERAWEYVFWADLDTDTAEPAMAAALEDLAPITTMVRVLGSYPRAPGT